MPTLKIVRDEFAPEAEWEIYETDDALGLLKEKLGGDRLPEFARLYHGAIAQANDVTPEDDDDLAALARAPGPLIAVMHAGADLGISTILAIAAVIIGIDAAPMGFIDRRTK